MSKKKIEQNLIEQIVKPQRTTRKDIEFYPTGITLLDLALGGGLGKGYISNICGWEAAGKTMIACESLAYNENNTENFSHKLDNAESGFTLDTKQLFNFNVNLIEPRSEKVEQFMYNVKHTLTYLKDDKNMIYVLDSLDGLSDDREEKKHEDDMKKVKKSLETGRESDIKGDYGGKAKLMSQFFRQNNAKINKTKMHLMITSQLRDKVGVIYGKPADRTGGKALNFYAAQIMWLKVVQKLTKKISIDGKSFERKIGTLINAQVTKNKLGKSFRECFLFIDFDYGVDNIKSNLYFLYDLLTPEGKIRTKEKLEWDGSEYTVNGLIRHIEDKGLEKELENRVKNLWYQIEEKLLIKRKKKY